MNEAKINKAFNLKRNNSYNVNYYNKPPSSKTKKGGMNIFKVALHMLKNKKGGLKTNSKSALPASTNTALTQIMGSVRPLYLQSSVGDMSPTPSSQGMTMMSSDQYEASPCHPTYEASSSTSRCSSRRSLSSIGGMTSLYASAQSLYDLDTHDDDDDDNTIEEENDGDAYYDGLEGDELIDVKAELFIANFYQQMRLQD